METGSLWTRKERNIWLGNSLTSKKPKTYLQGHHSLKEVTYLKPKGIFNQIFQWTVENITFYIYEKITGTKC